MFGTARTVVYVLAILLVAAFLLLIFSKFGKCGCPNISDAAIGPDTVLEAEP